MSVPECEYSFLFHDLKNIFNKFLHKQKNQTCEIAMSFYV